jgi:hypothetical protein
MVCAPQVHCIGIPPDSIYEYFAEIGEGCYPDLEVGFSRLFLGCARDHSFSEAARPAGTDHDVDG